MILLLFSSKEIRAKSYASIILKDSSAEKLGF